MPIRTLARAAGRGTAAGQGLVQGLLAGSRLRRKGNFDPACGLLRLAGNGLAPSQRVGEAGAARSQFLIALQR